MQLTMLIYVSRPELLALPDPIEHTVEAHNAWVVSLIYDLGWCPLY